MANEFGEMFVQIISTDIRLPHKHHIRQSVRKLEKLNKSL